MAKRTMKWIPISEFKSVPRWEGDTAIIFEVGTQLLGKDGHIELLGDDIAGYRTIGCDCCSEDWEEIIDNYTHYRVLDLPTDLPY